MDVGEAWAAIGGDVAAVLARARAAGTLEARVAAVRASLGDARRLARAAMARHHPDKNPGDPGAPARFVRVQEALRIIEGETAEFERKAAARAEQLEQVRDDLIVFR